MDTKFLIDQAKKVVGEYSLGSPSTSAASVAAALITESGNIYTGVCIVANCGIGFCAEHSAIAEMLKNRETRIIKIVALTNSEILPPCGRCRELMYQVNKANLQTEVILPNQKSMLLSKLLPEIFE